MTPAPYNPAPNQRAAAQRLQSARTPTPPPQTMVGKIQQVVGQMQRGVSMEIFPRRVMGEVAVVGAGEAAVDVKFPVWFIEKPNFTFGGELAEGHSPEATNFPTISVVVLSWTLETHGAAKYYVGAKLGIVTTGVATHQMVAHWAAEGKAMQNPRSNIPNIDAQF